MKHTRMRLYQLAGPIFIENMLRTSLMSIDTLMLSSFNEKAVAAMSLVNVFAFFIQLVYMVISIGSNILISQNLGAGRKREASWSGLGSYALVVAFSLVVSVAAVLLMPWIISLYNLDPLVAQYCIDFMTIFAGLSVFMAFNIIQGSILRAWGYPNQVMTVNIIALVFTVLGNYLVLFGPLGLPKLGVKGVAYVTVLSQIISCVIYAVLISRKKEIESRLSQILKVPGHIYRQILAIGLPSGGEIISYNVSQIVIISMVAGMGTETMAAFGILMPIIRYIFMPGLSIGSGAQIKVGYLVGAGEHDHAHTQVYKYFAAGFSISLALALIINLFKQPIMQIFTMNPAVISVIAAALVVSIVLEPGRNLNTIIIPALKGAGDVRFPVIIGIISMWGIGVLGAWLLGVHFKLGLPGLMAAMAADEWLRGIVMLFRWKSGVWRRMGLVN